jgi:CRP-like cAMP-binding protein
MLPHQFGFSAQNLIDLIAFLGARNMQRHNQPHVIERDEKAMTYLRAVDLLTAAQLEKILDGSVIKKFDVAATITRRNDAASHLFYIESGRVKCSRTSAAGAEIIVRVVGTGSFFSWLHLFARLPAPFDIVAIEPTVVRGIDLAYMESLILEDQSIARIVMTIMSQRLALGLDMTADALSDSAEKRVGKQLVQLSLDLAPRDDGTVLLRNVSHEQVAMIAGLSRVQTTLVLGEFQRRGFIELGRKSIKILNPRALLDL